MSGMHGSDPLVFNYDTADGVVTAFSGAANTVQGQSASRASYVTTGAQDFQGHFADLFAANASTAAVDAGRLVEALRLVSTYALELREAAWAEDGRRRRAREWKKRQDDRSVLECIGDAFTGGEDAPTEEAKPAPRHEAAAPPAGSRNTPSPTSGGGGGGGGTSSARPSNLRSFATGTSGLDALLSGTPGLLRGKLADFAAQCQWGTLDGSGVVTAYEKWLEANANDTRWATTLADAFAAAGGEGNVSWVSDAALGAALSAAGVQASRSGLQIDPPTAFGAPPTTGYSMDPVNTATGNFIEPEVDLGCAGGAASLKLSRMYNSLDTRVGLFGPGWSSALETALTLSDEGAVWRMDDGREVHFPREGTGWGRGVGENVWLASEATEAVPEGADRDLGSTLVVRDNSGSWWSFTAAGVWLGSGSGAGTAVRVVRDGEGDITRLVHERGRFLTVEYGAGRVAVVQASDGRRVEYVYDEAGRLVGVRSPLGVRTYRWNEAGLIEAVVATSGVVEARNEYDDSGRVTLQVSPHGRRVRFAYLPGRVTVVSDEDGSRSNSWIADAKGRLVGVLDSEDRRQSMSYDSHGNLVSSIARDGGVTVHAYDERGRKVRTVTPEGADITYGWDDRDRVTTLVTESGSAVEYEYSGDDRNPSVIRDPLGGRTEMTWTGGLLTRVVDPVGVAVSFTYDEHGDLLTSTNAAGDTARIVRDQAGRPVQAITPGGSVTRFTYDGTGLLASREGPDGATWRFEHDSVGRVTAILDPLGARTEMTYGPSGELIRTTDALGRVVERSFDDLGNVAGVVLPDGARWGFAHDALSRLTAITDPGGHDWTREYGPNGAMSAVVDPTGVRLDASADRSAGTGALTDAFASVSFQFDEYGRPSRMESADGAAELVTYDGAGHPVELVDGEGGLTRLERDVAGKIIRITSPAGAVTRFEYDLCGRPWKTVDPLGAVTTLTYDADSRVVERTLATGEVEAFTYDVAGRLTSRVAPGHGVARYAYDKVGRLTYSQDTYYGTRRFRYNAAGELVRVVNGVGGETCYEYDARGRLLRVTDPVGGVTTRTYTDTDKVALVTDPLARVTTATYDAAGRQLTQTDPDGHTMSWTYDRAGRQDTVSIDGRLVSSVSRDAARRRVQFTDHTRSDGQLVEHTLEYDRRGQLIRRTRGDGELRWAYDADGRRVSFTDHTGTTTRYTHDRAGNLTGIAHPHLGEAFFAYDAAGRTISSSAGDVAQSWDYTDGWLTGHTRTGAEGVDTTVIGRDDMGRVVTVTHGAVTTYSYDEAGQLVSAQTDSDGETSRLSWEYDAAGRLVVEGGAGGAERQYTYDAVGQLLSTIHGGVATRYSYDGSGRRIREAVNNGSGCDYVWDPRGYLTRVAAHGADGAVTRQHELWVDATGELAEIATTSGNDSAVAVPVWWDTARPFPMLIGVGETQVLPVSGGVTGIGGVWTTPGWRATRATDVVDPWAVIGAAAVPGTPVPGSGGGGAPGSLAGGAESDAAGALAGLLPVGVDLTASGGVSVGGLEWLGARTYDPATRGFLSVDPLEPVLGAGWSGNPYAYAGNNPVGLSDPTGLRPVTDEELAAYNNANNGVFAAVGDWLGDNWEYVVGGLAIVGGIALMCTGVGGPAGIALMAGAGALMGGGISVVSQKAQNGSVDWKRVGVDTLIGAATGAAGGWAGGLVRSGAAATASEQVMAAGSNYLSKIPWGQMGISTAVNSAVGGLGNVATYSVTNHSNWSLAEAGAALLGGAVSGAAIGGAAPLAGPMSSTLLRNITQLGISGGGSVAGGWTQSAVAGQEYDGIDAVIDATTGGALSYFPGASDLSVAPGIADFIGVAGAGQCADWSLDSLRFAGEETGIIP
ncbi:hypothetical protein GCM10022198_14610 [Klugiella xanthotipulae]|uniref:RHS repeat-associated protein n=1 Tax=Klugiella xanthotipulae TaxID=244735 RepID=A0A543I4S3_9MICO|nr:DUF6531 domain-containing protein [Klugiella xanthotipulae]TQM65551.1 RHS repeat-associated protein [Klugiella xanthotipulae]